MKSGNINFLEHSGPLQACNGTALTLCVFRETADTNETAVRCEKPPKLFHKQIYVFYELAQLKAFVYIKNIQFSG